MGTLSGRVALVTGAGGMRGIGRATALTLAAEGADLVLSDVRRAPDDLPPQEVGGGWRSIDSVSEEVEALGRRCLRIWCDLGDSEQIQAMVRHADEEYGRIDMLINNARAIVGRDRVPVTQLPREVWDHFMAINVTAAFLCTKFVAQVMIRQGRGGRIINIGSSQSKRGTALGAAYSASKFALLGLTQASALDLAQYGITVNAVCPGTVDTDRLSYEERAQAEAERVPLEELRARISADWARHIPLGRVAQAQDVADLVAYLASDKASFITGQAYNVNGGTLFH